MSNPFKGMTIPMIMVFIGGIAGALGAFLSALDQDKESKRNALLNEKLAAKSDTIAESQKKITELNERITNYVVGGDSWCRLYLTNPTDNDIKVKLFHEGEFPLSALRITIVRHSLLLKEANGNSLSLKFLLREPNNQITIPVGPLPRSPQGLDLGAIPFDPNIDEQYEITFIAQNGIWTQNYNFKKGKVVDYPVYRNNKRLY